LVQPAKKNVSKREQTRRRRLAARRTYLKKSYGITLEAYEAQLAVQGGVCAICRGGTSKPNFAVDHNHKNGVNRGLLCWRCNSGLAKFMDRKENVYRAWKYLIHDGVWKKEGGKS